MTIVIAIDPGKDKCGIILSDISIGYILDGKVVKTDSVINLLRFWESRYLIEFIIMGNGTSYKFWKSKLEENGFVPIKIVDEKGTTFKARERFLDLFPPGFLLRLIPRGLLLPPENLDAIAALILLENYFDKKLVWKNDITFKTWP